MMMVTYRIIFVGKVVIDLFYHENYIVFATGNNSPLEKFNATIANTKFPWEDDE